MQPEPQQPSAAGGKAAAAVRQQGQAQPAAPEQPEPSANAEAPSQAASVTEAAEQQPDARQQYEGSSVAPLSDQQRPLADEWETVQVAASNGAAEPEQSAPAQDSAHSAELSAKPASSRPAAVEQPGSPQRGSAAESPAEDEDADAILAGVEEPAATGSARQLVQGAQVLSMLLPFAWLWKPLLMICSSEPSWRLSSVDSQLVLQTQLRLISC